MKRMKTGFIGLLVFLLVVLAACGISKQTGSGGVAGESGSSSGEENASKDPIKIGLIAATSGALEAYGKQTVRGFKMGIQYATDGTNKVNGHPIEIIVEDGEGKAEVAIKQATKLLGEEKVDFLVGTTSSAAALAILPLAKQYKTIMVVEPAVADSITGKYFNEYIFRTARNSSQDAAAAAAAIAEEGVTIATLAPDYAFGHDGVEAFKREAEERGAKVILEEYADPKSTDFTAHIQKIIDADPDYLWVTWAGANTPWKQIQDMKVQAKGIKLSTGAPNIAALKTMKAAVGMVGFTVYYYTLPDNEVNDWLIQQTKKQYHKVPDLFTPGGMSAAIAIVKALKKAGTDASTDELIKTMEGMSFMTPKGEMTFRKEDHQALQTMYKIILKDTPDVNYPEPVLLEKLSPKQTAPPIKN